MARVFNEENVAPAVKDRMLRSGVILFMATLLAALALAHADVSATFRFALFAPFLAATYAIHLGLYGTCGFMAARGYRATTDGLETVADRHALCKLRMAGYRVIASSAVSAFLATGVLAFATR